MTALAVTALALSGALVSTAASAAPAAKPAADCKHTVTHESPGSQSGVVKNTLNLKSGPYAACENGKQLPAGTKIWLWCYTYNNYKHLWFYGRVEGTQTKGWVYADSLVWSGQSAAC
ncbi:hypothetical protein ADK38_05985 [Streptomyces varsoviensis]|uniref:SH3b domain-containing protein n=2 Tax=Streptomyces varsoviensis TaxID=67373 RepID=A0ABR5JC35_9ACTN|nr:hypothetical protein ADK38_05985 [Streptomyces varsoviensis]